MVFSSSVFLFCFLPLMLLLTGISKMNYVKNYILLLGSLLFYAWGEPRYVFLMILSIYLNAKKIATLDPREKEQENTLLDWMISP